MKLFFSLVGLMLLVSTVQADSINTIQLRNRPAAEIIPIVKPILGADEAISGQGFKIFLRSSAATLAEIKGMIETLDAAAKILQISVFQGNTRGLKALGLSGSIRVESDGARIGAGTNRNSGGDGGASIKYGTGNASGGISGNSTRIRLEDSPIHQLRVTEGSEAYIETGAQIPYFSGAQWIAAGNGAGGIKYKKVTTGFYVLPRLHGDSVTLQVSPFKNSQSKTGGGKIDTQRAKTTITGRVGEWLLIDGATEQVKRSQSGADGYKSTQSRGNQSIWIKTDLVQ